MEAAADDAERDGDADDDCRCDSHVGNYPIISLTSVGPVEEPRQSPQSEINPRCAAGISLPAAAYPCGDAIARLKGEYP
jgi:hypothetical protein